ncbi:MAG: ABC-type uncharacterized transport system permease subunit [Parasphingorhabdus sp.]|jgi:ABC-type uncharacterized transport system permease subunit
MNFVHLESIWNLGALLFYGYSVFSIFRNIASPNPDSESLLIRIILLGAGFHLLSLSGMWSSGTFMAMGLGPALSLVAWIVVVLFLLALLRHKVLSLGLIVQPFAIAALIIAWLLISPAPASTFISNSAMLHMLVALIAYSLLGLAFAMAVLLLVQEWQLQNKRAGNFFHSLPAMQSLEHLLFQIIGLGFMLLTVALLSGGVFSSEIFGSALKFNHHIVLSILGWLAFGGLLLGRKLVGLRGRVAAIWTIASFVLLMLAYFGTKLVLEVFLQRV